MPKMTIRQCMDFALQLLNQYSIAGALVPISYNDQADTEKRMINLINDAQMQIATTAKPITEFFTVEVREPTKEDPKETEEVDMPDGFDKPSAIYFTPARGGQILPVDAGKYKWLGDDTLVLPRRPAGTYRVEYTRFPIRFAPDTPQTAVLDNTPDTHEIIPYFVAAMIAVDENPKAYFALYNVWETRLSRLGYKPAHAVSTQVADVYGFSQFGGVY